MSDTHLFTVLDALVLSGKLTLVPGLPQNPDLPTIRIGVQIRLVAPDGTSVESHIAGFEKISYEASCHATKSACRSPCLRQP